MVVGRTPASGSAVRSSSCHLENPLITRSRRLTMRRDLKLIGSRDAVEKQIKLEDRRQKLEGRIQVFMQAAQRFVQQDFDVADMIAGHNSYTGNEWDTFDVEDADEIGDGAESIMDIEQISAVVDVLPLPSTFGWKRCNSLKIAHVADQELELRYGQANDALHQIRIALGHKSHLFRENVRKAESQRQKLRAFDQVAAVETTVRLQAAIYTLARNAMSALNAPEEMLEKYKPLERSDLKVRTALIDPNSHGLGSASSNFIGWIWTIDTGHGIDDDAWVSECEFHRYISQASV